MNGSNTWQNSLFWLGSSGAGFVMIIKGVKCPVGSGSVLYWVGKKPITDLYAVGTYSVWIGSFYGSFCNTGIASLPIVAA
jgi:hypothetical protein